MSELMDVQKKALEIANALSENSPRQLLVDGAPGCGKSAIAPLIFPILRRKAICEKVIILTPNNALAEQGQAQFAASWIQAITGEANSINRCTSCINPSRNTAGIITTYQAVAADAARLFEYELLKTDYAIFADECHHIRRNGAFHKAMQGLWDLAKYRVMLSGTLYRSDRSPIAFLPYLNEITQEKSIETE